MDYDCFDIITVHYSFPKQRIVFYACNQMTHSDTFSDLDLSLSIELSDDKDKNEKNSDLKSKPKTKIGKSEPNNESTQSNSSGYAQFEEKQFEYSSNGQSIELGKKMIASLPMQLKKLDLDLEWDSDKPLPKGIQLNEHTGTIHGRVEQSAEIGTFEYQITAEKHSIKWTATYSLKICQAPIKRLEYPNGNILILTRNEKITSQICPVIEGTFPHSFSIHPFGAYIGDMPDGLTFETKTGTFNGCPKVRSKTSWKVTATNAQNSLESNTIVIDVRRSSQEFDEPKLHFSIPRKVFVATELQIAFETFKPNDSGKLGIEETANILRACGKTPTPSEIQTVFAQHCNGKTYVTVEDVSQMMNHCSFYEIDLKEIHKIFEATDKDKTGHISVKKFREIMRSGNGVKEAVIADICATVDDKGKGFINYHDLLDLYSRISFGIRYD